MSDLRASAAVRAALKGQEPTDEQWAAISHPLEPVYLIAGAGSGKTAVMAARIAWALETHALSPGQILGLTFTNKAAGELNERIHLALAELQDESGEEVTVQTYNAFAASVVRDHGLLVGIEPEAGLLTEAQKWQLLMACLDELPPFEALEIRSSYVVGRALSLASSVSDHMVPLDSIDAAADQILSMRGIDEDMITTAMQRKELVRAVSAYIRSKQKSSRIDFGDQIAKAFEILNAFPEVRDLYRQRFPFVLLDEYQDTNVAQRKMLQELVGENGAVTAVGDARQAIFAWRGATMYNLIGFPDDFPRADGKRYEPVSLSQNFRSGSRILDVANHVVEKIDVARRPGMPLSAQPWNGTGEVCLGLFSDEMAEARWIAQRCEELRGEPTAEGRDPVEWKDIAILVRRKLSMDAILQALEEREIPVEVVGLGGLLRTPEVMEIVSWLRAIESRPAANRWLARILLGPRWRVHYRDLSLLARWATSQNWEYRLKLAGGDAEQARDQEPGDVGYSLGEALNHLDEIEDLGPEARKRMSAFAEQIGALRRRANAPLPDLVQEVIKRSGIADALRSSNSRTAPAALQNISNFMDQVAGFAPVEGEATVRSFIDYLDAADQAEETLDASQPAEQDSVKLMTVHSAKGLEFECVFVPSVAAREGKTGKANSIFPNTRSSNPLTSFAELPYEVREDAGHLPRFEGNLRDFKKAVQDRVVEDERRLFYVALTRAKQRLAVTAAWWYGRDKSPKGPSEFWEEIEELEGKGLLSVAVRQEQPEENPMFGFMEERREWPPVGRSGTDDPLFADGWGTAADLLVGKGTSIEDLLAGLDPAERARAAELLDGHRATLSLIASADRGDEVAEPEIPRIVSATSLIRIDKGQLTAWDILRPLPDRPTEQRRIGTEVHRIIEEKARGIATYPDDEELDRPSPVLRSDRVDELLGHFHASGYAERDIAVLPSGEPMLEMPFTMKYGGRLVRGRIDAVYTTEDGGFEIVDFKTGARFEPGHPDQLEIYAEALKALGLIEEGAPVLLTYLFLDGGEPSTRTWIPA